MQKPHLSHHVSGFINLLAEFLSTWQGFVATFVVLIAGIAIGALLHFNEGFMFGFNIFLSVAAIVIAGVILVAGARSEAALHVKLDYLIEHSKATNKAIGIEHRDAREIEAARRQVEKEVAALDQAISARSHATKRAQASLGNVSHPARKGSGGVRQQSKGRKPRSPQSA